MTEEPQPIPEDEPQAQAIPVPIGGQPIQAAWGASVAKAINNLNPVRPSASSPLTLSGVEQDVPGAFYTWTPEITELVVGIMIFSFDVTAVDAGICVGTVKNNGALVNGECYGNGKVLGRATHSQVFSTIAQANTPTTIAMQARKTGAGSASCNSVSTRMLLFRYPHTS